MAKFLTPQEVADLYRVDVSTVRRWIADGHLRAIRLPAGTYRISEKEVDRLAVPAEGR